jgi:hypothetical protein
VVLWRCLFSLMVCTHFLMVCPCIHTVISSIHSCSGINCQPACAL